MMSSTMMATLPATSPTKYSCGFSFSMPGGRGGHGGVRQLRPGRRAGAAILLLPLVSLVLVLTVQHRDVHLKSVCKGGCPPGPQRVPGDDDCVVVVRDVLDHVLEEERRRAQVVHPAREETLRFFRVEVHRQEVVEAGLDTHVRNQLQGDVASPLHLRLLTVGKTGKDAKNVFTVGSLASVRHDQQLHDDVVDVPGGGLDDVDILAVDTLLDVDHGLPISVVVNEAAADPGAEVARYLLGEAGVGVAGQQHHAGLVPGVHPANTSSETLVEVNQAILA